MIHTAIGALVFAVMSAMPDAMPPPAASTPLSTSPAATATGLTWTHSAPPEGWLISPPVDSKAVLDRNGEYARYTYTPSSGSTSVLIARHQTCTCDPKEMASMLGVPFHKAFRDVSTSDLQMCGQPAVRVVASDLAVNIPDAKNSEVIAFCIDGYLIATQYSYLDSAPRASLDAAFASMCPSTAVS